MQDEQVRVLLLSAEGRGFCAGKDRDDPRGDAFVEALQRLAATLVQGPKPVIAAVQGWAVGAGFELALDCDLILASHDARFALPEARLGLLGTGGVHALLPRLVGLGRAKGMLWLGGEVDAAQAHAWALRWGSDWINLGDAGHVGLEGAGGGAASGEEDGEGEGGVGAREGKGRVACADCGWGGGDGFGAALAGLQGGDVARDRDGEVGRVEARENACDVADGGGAGVLESECEVGGGAYRDGAES